MKELRRAVYPPTPAIVVLLAICAAPLAAQCTNPWSPVPGSTGVEGPVADLLVFDPDGAGPLGRRLLVSGSFAVAGTVLAANLAVYEPTTRTWTTLGPGPYPANLCLAEGPTGDIYVGGNFTSIAGTAAAGIARWDGASWSALGSGVTGTVRAITPLPGGGLVVAGSITAAGGAPANGIARWDGSTWSALGTSALGGTITGWSVVGMPNGDLAAAISVSGTSSVATGVLRFDGTTWSQLGGAFGARRLLVLPSGDLVAGGGSLPGDSTQKVGRWNGTAWLPLPAAPFQDVSDLDLMPNGDLLAAGRFGSSSQQRAAVWDGLHWTTLGESTIASTSGSFSALAVLGNEVFVGGNSLTFGDVSVNYIARWNTSKWSPASPGLALSTRWLATLPNGGVFAGTATGSLVQGLVQRWNGLGWVGIGSGFALGSGNSPVLTGLVGTPSGRLIALGRSSGTTAMPVAEQWTGSAWTTLATSPFGEIRAAVELPNGDLVVGGSFATLSDTTATNVARLSGSTWTPLGTGPGQTVNALAVAPNGDPIALAGLSVMRWNGSEWLQIGLSMPTAPTALVIDRSGAPVIAGNFSGNGVLRWNGVTWVPLGGGTSGAMQSLVVLANGDLVAGPTITGSPRPLERWNGSTWSPLGGPIDATVWSLAVAPNGDLLLAGDFKVADGAVRARFARVSTSCPASVVAVPSNCTFSSGTLAAQTLPWIGGTCRTIATGLPSGGLAVVLTGTQDTAIPLATLLPWPTSNCLLLVLPILQDVVVPVGGRIEAQFAVPNDATMVGMPLHQQVLSLSLDQFGNIFSVRSSNALAFVTGSF
ncbi:MAG: hypothetical protein KF830_12805 [Planctomycetes bacterium]|nr:hypothetical protein [Planctomycetota bacterium]